MQIPVCLWALCLTQIPLQAIIIHSILASFVILISLFIHYAFVFVLVFVVL
jgi:hypothetical protein